MVREILEFTCLEKLVFVHNESTEVRDMKKYVVIGCIWFSILVVQVSSKTQDIQFQIMYDSNSKDTLLVKDKIQDIYGHIVKGVQMDSITVMLLNNIKRFEYRPDIEATWAQGELQIVEGDGKGIVIHGEFSENSVCLPEVKPRSFFQELFR